MPPEKPSCLARPPRSPRSLRSLRVLGQAADEGRAALLHRLPGDVLADAELLGDIADRHLLEDLVDVHGTPSVHGGGSVLPPSATPASSLTVAVRRIGWATDPVA